MENQTLEQPENELTPDNAQVLQPFAPADSVEASNKILDRFASVADLESAYKQLRAEFTKKSQRLSELERDADRGSASVAEQKPDETTVFPENTQMQNGGQQSGTQTAQMRNGEEAVQMLDLSNNKVIEEYLVSLASSKTAPAVITKPGVDFVSNKEREIKSINATTKIAEDFFKRKEK